MEGTLKIRGDIQQIVERDLVYFFPYTTHTVVVAIPGVYNTPRITDNEGGNKSLCEFSHFFKKAQWHLDSYKDEFYHGLLPNYYVVGYYDQEFKFVQNPDCFLFNEDSKKQMFEDIDYVNSQFDLFID